MRKLICAATCVAALAAPAVSQAASRPTGHHVRVAALRKARREYGGGVSRREIRVLSCRIGQTEARCDVRAPYRDPMDPGVQWGDELIVVHY